MNKIYFPINLLVTSFYYYCYYYNFIIIIIIIIIIINTHYFVSLHCLGLAYDTAYSENLFWCESDRGYVWIVNVETGTVRRIITEDNLNNPKNIVVVPKPR